MWAYLVQRVLQAIPVLVLSSIAVFVLMRMLPGDTAVLLAGQNASDEQIAAMRSELGLDQPLPIQYVVWAEHALRFDFGTSSFSRTSVGQLVAERAPATYELAFAALLISVPLGIVLGIAAAVRQGGALDYVITVVSSCLIATPNFFLGILFILIFAVTLGWLPPGGRGELLADPWAELRFLLLPAITLALPNAMGLSRLTKATTLEVLHDDYVRTARAKGLAGRAVLGRHVLRNALVPVSTGIGLEVGRLIGGAVIIESIFGWPGLGLLTLNAINSRDYAVVQATVLLLTVTYLAINIGIDLTYGALDPRIRLSARGRG